MGNNQKKVVSIAGREFVVDISDQVCTQFGFKHSDVVLDSVGNECTIEGVAPAFPADHNVLWYARKQDKGKVSSWCPDPNATYLPDHDFTLKKKF